MATAFVKSASLAATCLLALLLTGWLAVALPTVDARRLFATAMPPAATSPALAPAPESGADYAGRMLFEGRRLLAGGLYMMKYQLLVPCTCLALLFLRN